MSTFRAIVLSANARSTYLVASLALWSGRSASGIPPQSVSARRGDGTAIVDIATKVYRGKTIWKTVVGTPL